MLVEPVKFKKKHICCVNNTRLRSAASFVCREKMEGKGKKHLTQSSSIKRSLRKMRRRKSRRRGFVPLLNMEGA